MSQSLYAAFPQQSPSIGALGVALCQVQAGLRRLKPKNKNPLLNNKYADLAAVWDHVRAPLTEAGLSVVQTTRTGERGIVVVSTLVHGESGEWIRGELEVVGKVNKGVSEAQAAGSAISYARRYSLAALVGVTVSDEDDDGNRAGARSDTRKEPPPPAEGIVVDQYLDALDLLIEKAEIEEWGKSNAADFGKLHPASQEKLRRAYSDAVKGAK